MKIIINETQLQNLVKEQVLGGQTFKGVTGDPYEYFYKNNKYYYRNPQKSPKWIEATNPKSIESIKNLYVKTFKKEPTTKPIDKTEPTTKTINKTEPAKDRSWTDTLTKSFKDSFSSIIRKISPNLAQLISSKSLTENDFTDNQKNIIYNTIQNAIKRNKKESFGCTEYIDYNSEIAQKLMEKSVGTTEMVLRSVGDDDFKIASTLGRFCYKKLSPSQFLATDVYDFNKSPEYSKIPNETIKVVKNLNSYPEKLFYTRKNIPGMDSLYRSIRFVAWTENPAEEGKGQPIKVVVSKPA